jgi:hypothetical protein
MNDFGLISVFLGAIFLLFAIWVKPNERVKSEK